MLLLLSPAKSLNFAAAGLKLACTRPALLAQASELIDLLRQESPQQIATLLHLSDALSGQAVARYQAWTATVNSGAAKPAVLAFSGDVYQALDASTLTPSGLAWLQKHVYILSALYGVLRPLDAMQPYRLEMNAKLANSRGKDLYAFWGQQIAQYVEQRCARAGSAPVVNLASKEYFKALASLQTRVVTCVFEEFTGGKYRVVSFHAKRARGLMARFAAIGQCTRPQQLTAFNCAGYQFDAAASEPDRMVFRRGAK